jgi:hypothetical protein
MANTHSATTCPPAVVMGAGECAWMDTCRRRGAVAQSISRSHSLRGIWGAVLYLGVIAVGGLIVGSVTGVCLVWMFRRHAPRLTKAEPDATSAVFIR